MFVRVSSVVLCLFAICNGATAQAGPFSSIIAFGDSTTDTGNVFLGSGMTVPPSPPYFAGRFSNGPNWLDQFSAATGAGPAIPVLAGGNNYAFGAARSGSGLVLGLIPNVQTQVGGYLSSTLGVADPNALYVIWAGSNDYIGDGQTDPNIPTTNIAASVQALASAGATQFMVMNLAPLGETPASISNLNPLQRAALDQLTIEHNQLLKQKLDLLDTLLPITIYRPNIYQLFQNVASNPLAYGFTDITHSSLADSNFTGAGYLFWDDLHPTTLGHSYIAGVAIASIPEPSTLVLIA
ncbi:MAG: SGNH/GDSL hydrolase family protein [Planctomycetota bacterium]|nr:SGNH/GDSL hydrolase family protein [Planctomycetota bacterium]